MDPTPRQIATLHPELQPYAVAVTTALREAGLPAVVVEGYRSQARQAALFAKGQLKNDLLSPVTLLSDAARAVTMTLNSKHTARLAWDTAFLVNGRITWDVPNDWWDYLGEVGESYGLRWGGRWKRLRDRPHLEVP